MPKKTPLGPALDWSDAELDTLAEITEQDIAAAQTFWRDTAPALFQRLLEAEVEDKLLEGLEGPNA